MMVLSLLTAAALEPEIGLHVNMGTTFDSSPPALIGIGGQVAFDPWRRLHIELAGDAGMNTRGEVWGGIGPRIRLYAWAPEKTVLSLFGGGGVSGGELGLRPLLEGGLALDLLRSNGARPRIQARYGWTGATDHRVLLSLGVVFGRRAPVVSQPAPLVVGPSTPPPEEPGELVVSSQGMIWVPGPVCQWLPGDEALAQIGELGLTLEKVTAIGPRTLADPDGEQQEDPSRPGRIAISASPQDAVYVDDTRHPVSNGLLVLEHPDGRAEVRIQGGGREQRLVLGITRDNVVWVDAGEPDPTRVLFDVGSAVLDATARTTIETFAANLGAWHVELFGSYSPEGDVAANRALGVLRAEAVHDALIAAGAPEAQVHLGPVQPPPAGLAPTEMRNATLQPVEAP